MQYNDYWKLPSGALVPTIFSPAIYFYILKFIVNVNYYIPLKIEREREGLITFLLRRKIYHSDKIGPVFVQEEQTVQYFLQYYIALLTKKYLLNFNEFTPRIFCIENYPGNLDRSKNVFLQN